MSILNLFCRDAIETMKRTFKSLNSEPEYCYDNCDPCFVGESQSEFVSRSKRSIATHLLPETNETPPELMESGNNLQDEAAGNSESLKLLTSEEQKDPPHKSHRWVMIMLLWFVNVFLSL